MQDNLNTHTPGALYDTFLPTVARRILQRLEFHYTPKHASWLNMAKLEIGVLQRCCLKQRLAALEAVQTQVAALQAERHHRRCRISRQFTTLHARQKLRRLYPQT